MAWEPMLKFSKRDSLESHIIYRENMLILNKLPMTYEICLNICDFKVKSFIHLHIKEKSYIYLRY